MKVLYHVAVDLQDNPLEAAFVDGNGRKYVIPAFIPTEFESDWIAGKIVEHCHYYGIVEVTQIREKSGIRFDIAEAEKRATAALLLSEKTCINDYVKTQLQDRVKNNAPPLPPEGRALECVVKHRYNLLRAGIRPVGWEPPYDMPEADQRKNGTYQVGGTEVEARLKQLENENEKLRSELRQFMQAVAGQAGLGRSKGKQAPAPASPVPDDSQGQQGQGDQVSEIK